MRKLFTILIIFSLGQSSFAKSNKAKKESSQNYNIRELALPSEVENIGKKAGSIYYSPSVKGKVLIPVHFWGQIKNTGLHFVPVDTTLINGISLAGGPSSDAEFDDVYVTTKRNGGREKLSFDISDGGDINIEDFKLQPGDTVFIPKDNFYRDRAYYTSLVGVVLTVLSSILLYRQVRN
jgi:protein involved in polysaccharide export with SLBB domain